MSDPAVRYGYLALKDGRGYVFPLARGSAGHALDVYSAQSWKAKAGKRLLAWALRLGAGRTVLPPAEIADAPLLDHLRAVLGQPGLTFAISLGVPGPHRKPVLQALLPDGRTVAFIKVGWNTTTLRLVENEHSALNALNGLTLQSGSFPAVFGFGGWHERNYLITEPFSMGDRILDLQAAHITFLLEIAQLHQTLGSFTGSPFYRQMMTNFEQLEPVLPRYQRAVLARALETVASALGAEEMPWGWCLGDFTPWNTGLNPDTGRVLEIDLESATSEGLPGWDIFHFLAQSPATARQMQDPRFVHGNAALRHYFTTRGLPERSIPTLYLAYLVDLWLTWRMTWFCSGMQLHPRSLIDFRRRMKTVALAIENIG